MELADYIYSKNYVKSFTYMSTYDSLNTEFASNHFYERAAIYSQIFYTHSGQLLILGLTYIY